MAVDWQSPAEAIATLGFVTNRPVVPLVATMEARHRAGRSGEPEPEDREIAREMGREPGRETVERTRQAEELAARWSMIRIMRGMV